MIPAYNCSAYLPLALQSVLQQVGDRGDVQVEVVDDCSNDTDMAQLVREMSGDRVTCYRQSENVGSLRNFETCLLRSRGSLIHLLHADDMALPGFYEKMERLFEEYPQVGAASCRINYIDEQGGLIYPSELEMAGPGILENWLFRLAGRQRIQTPSVVVKREVYEHLGGFYGVHYGEDWEMWIRIAAHYPFAYCPDILAAYRRHSASITGRYFLTAQNIRDLKKVMQLTERYIPEKYRADARGEAEKFYAKYAISTARMLWPKTKNRKAVRSQIKEAVSLYLDGEMIKEIIKLNIKMALNIS